MRYNIYNTFSFNLLFFFTIASLYFIDVLFFLEVWKIDLIAHCSILPDRYNMIINLRVTSSRISYLFKFELRFHVSYYLYAKF